MPFVRGKASDEDWGLMQACNSTQEALRARKLPAVRPEGDAARSKGVWLIRGLQQALLYRAVMLADGCMEGWNANNPLSALLCSRAMVETAAVLWDLQRQYKRLVDEKDFKGIYDLTVDRAHGTKLEEWLKEDAGVKAVNVLTLLTKLEAEMPTAIKAYNQLSEFCHPNYCGHRLIFSKLDHGSAVLTFGDEIWLERNVLVDILQGVSLVAFIDEWLTEIDNLMPSILALSEAARERGEA